jgi:cytochrome P450
MNKHILAKIPGPKPSDPQGHHNLADIAACKGLHLFQIKCHQQYGPVTCFWLDKDTPIVSINDPVMLEALVNISERPRKLFAFLEPLVGLEQVLPKEEAKTRRKQVIPALNKISSLKNFHPTLAKAVHETMNHIDNLMKVDGKVMLQRELTDLSVETIGQIAFQGDFRSKHDRQTLIHSLELVLNNMMIDQYQLPCEKSKEDRDKEQREMIQYLHSTIDEIIQKHKQSQQNLPEDCLINILIKSIPNTVDLRNALIAILVAGYHTTGVATSWVLYALAKEPQIIARIQAEIDQVFGTAPITLEKLSDLTLLDKAVKEGMRLYPAGAYGARVSENDLIIGGYQIPAHTTLFLPIWAVHLNEKYWPQPHTFDPERFSPENEASRHPLAYIPFGIGSRVCSGKKLGTIEILYLTAELLRNYNIQLDPNHEVNILERFVNWAENDISMIFTRRTPKTSRQEGHFEEALA